MKAMILAAGRGQRLRPLTDKQPKPLFNVRGKPLIQWHIERLRDTGFEQLVVNVAWLKQQLIDFLGDGSRFGIPIYISEEPPGALETGGGIHHALGLLGKNPFVVVNGDIYTDYPFGKLLVHPLRTALAHLVMVDNPAHHPDGDFQLTANGTLNCEGDCMLTYSGIGLFHPELFRDCPPSSYPLLPLLQQGISMDCVSGEYFNGQWSDVGTPERLRMLNAC